MSQSDSKDVVILLAPTTVMVESPTGRSKKSDVSVGQVKTPLMYTPRDFVGDVSMTAVAPAAKFLSASTSMNTPSAREIFSFFSALSLAVNVGNTRQLPLTVNFVPLTAVFLPYSMGMALIVRSIS